MKAKSRFLGIDDAPFRFSDETVPVVGVVVQAPSYIEGILTTLAEVDGHDATERIASMVRRSRYRAGLAAILIDGTAVGGFNVIAIDAVRASPISWGRGSSEANRGDAPDSVRPRTSHLMGNRRRAAIPPNASSFWPAS